MIRLLKLAVFAGIAAAFVSAPLLAKRPVTPEDYFRFQSIADVKLSPDGRQAAYVLTVVNEPRNRRENAVWLVATAGRTPPRRLTADGMNSTVPRWSPDGARLAFLSSRATEVPTGSADAPRPQIWLLPMNGGEAHVLTHLKSGVSAFQWSPDGQRFVVVSRIGPSDLDPSGFRRPDTRHYMHIRYKFNDTGWYDDRRNHLWVVDAQTGTDQQLTTGDDWNGTDPQWSPASTRIAFVSDRTGKEYDGGHNKDVFVIAASGGALTKISDHELEDEQPRWSSDGKQIAFTGKVKRDLFPKIYVGDAAGGKPAKLIAPDLDLIPDNVKWIAPSEIRFDTGYKGQFHMFRVDVTTGTINQVTSGDRSVHG